MAKETITLGRIHRLVVDHDEKSLRLECVGTPDERRAFTPAERDAVLDAFREELKRLAPQGYWLVH